MTHRDDFKNTIKDELNNQAESLFRAVWGEPAASGAAQWRPKTASSRSMVMRGVKRGLWYDHISGNSGDPLDLIAVEMCGLSGARDDFPRVLREASAWCGVGPAAAQSNSEVKKRRADKEKAIEAAKAADTREAEKKAALVARLVEASQPIGNSPARTYLSSRSIDGHIPDGLAFLPSQAGNHELLHSDFAALVVWAKNAAGAVVGGQRIVLRPDGTRPGVDAGKPSFGSIQGFPARFPARVQEGPLCIAEGPETALSVWQATGFETWAVFGVSSWKGAPIPAGRETILCPDRDTPVGTYPADSDQARRQESAARAFNKAVQHHIERGCLLSIALAPEQVGSKRDLNDTHRRAGLDAVRDAVLSAQPIGPRPRYKAPTGTVQEAREVVKDAFDRWRDSALSWLPDEGDETPAPVWALRVTTGVGKTYAARRAALETIAELRKAGDMRPVVIAVPRHRLGAEYLEEFEGHGVVVKAYLGWSRADPMAEGEKMCRRADEAVAVRKAGGDVEKTLCKAGDVVCPFYEVCGTRRQKKERADIWLLPHAMLPKQPPPSMKNAAALIIDEDPTNDFFKGFDINQVRLSLDDMTAPIASASNSENADLIALTGQIADVARGSPSGKIDPQLISASADHIADIRKLAYRHIEQPACGPDAPFDVLMQELGRIAGQNKRLLNLANLLDAIRTAKDKSGRLVPGPTVVDAKTKEGETYKALSLRWLDRVAAGWNIPTIIASATLQHKMVRAVWPQVQPVVEATAAMPFVTVRQITDRAFGRGSVAPDDTAPESTQTYSRRLQNRLRRYIKHRSMQNPGKVLVIAQESVLAALGDMPCNVDTLHFNDLSGLDVYKNVRLIIQIGRPMPTFSDVEARAELILGDAIEGVQGWYDKKAARLTMVDGSAGPEVFTRGGRGQEITLGTDYHPDETAEAVRWSICESELMQGIGRGRGVNRTAENPLQIDILTNVPLPVPVNEASIFESFEPQPVEILRDMGVRVQDTSAKGAWALIAALLPDIYPNGDAARKSWGKQAEILKFPKSPSRGNNPISIYIGKIPRDAKNGDLSQIQVKPDGSRYYTPVAVGPGSNLSCLSETYGLSVKQDESKEDLRSVSAIEVLPLTPAEATRCYPDVWGSKSSAERALSNIDAATYWTLEYQCAPLGGRRMRKHKALVRAGSQSAAQKALISVVGPLQSLTVLSRPQRRAQNAPSPVKPQRPCGLTRNPSGALTQPTSGISSLKTPVPTFIEGGVHPPGIRAAE